MKLSARTFAAAFALVASLATPARAQVIFDFGHRPEGLSPAGPLLMDQAGAVYGVAYEGGASNNGTAYRLTPPPAGQTAWSYTRLFEFPGGAGGARPLYNLVMDSAGALYGVTQAGGPTGRVACMEASMAGCGTIYKLAPPASGAAPWIETVLANVSDFETDSLPASGLVRGSDGALYGVTDGYSTPGSYGGVYRLTPPAPGQTVWGQTLLHSFDGADGWVPQGTLAIGAGGSLFGVTQFGGPVTPACTVGCGIAYRLAPPASGQSSWREQILYSFGSAAGDGTVPREVIIAANGTLYGDTQQGGNPTSDAGTVFSLAAPAHGGTPWIETTLYGFGTIPDGNSPFSLQQSKGGDLYGVTGGGGADPCPPYADCGTVFRLSPPAAGSAAWTESATYQLTAQTGGVASGLLLGADRALYVTNSASGPVHADVGTILRLAP